MGKTRLQKQCMSIGKCFLFPTVVTIGRQHLFGGQNGKIGEAFEQPYSALLENGVDFRAVIGSNRTFICTASRRRWLFVI